MYIETKSNLLRASIQRCDQLSCHQPPKLEWIQMVKKWIPVVLFVNWLADQRWSFKWACMCFLLSFIHFTCVAVSFILAVCRRSVAAVGDNANQMQWYANQTRDRLVCRLPRAVKSSSVWRHQELSNDLPAGFRLLAYNFPICDSPVMFAGYLKQVVVFSIGDSSSISPGYFSVYFGGFQAVSSLAAVQQSVTIRLGGMQLKISLSECG